MTEPPILELRTYRVRPGTAAELVRRMQEVLPVLARFGIDALGVRESLDHDPAEGEHVVLARLFSSLEERRSLEDAFYRSDYWVHGPRAGIMELVEGFHTVVLETTPEAARLLAGSFAGE
jgi:hypothetical protein